MRLPQSGSLPAVAAPDPRFSWFGYAPDGPADATLVLVHGTDRRAESMRDLFLDWAGRRRVVLVAPLFPAGLASDDDVDDYKYVRTGSVDHGAALDDIVDDVARRFGAPAQFAMVGFSGGGQFANRYLLLRPHRLRAVALCAPGNISRIDAARPWWVGTAHRVVDVAAVVRVPVLTVVGELDNGPAVPIEPTSPHWVEGADDTGRTRIDRAAALAENLRAHGSRVRSVQLPGAGHELAPMVDTVQDYLDEALSLAR